ncbi:MAG: PQQ-binding-like beta-propeller repeat protein, partial [Sedimentisphaerales bacterium]|nr:PQQ-binding-like beta-propeller repeat protein [Sedimentisphaerales bacterium]
MRSKTSLCLNLPAVAMLSVLLCISAVQSAPPQQRAEQILKTCGVEGGLIVHVGCGDGKVTAALRAGDAYIVHALDRDGADVTAARRYVTSRGLYGPVSVDRWTGNALPYMDNLANLVVVENEADVAMSEVMRVLAPHGVACIAEGDTLRTTTKPWPREMDEWTHYLHGPDGNPVADDSLVGPPTRLQWVGNPRWARHHDHMASMTSLVSARGRLFYILDEGLTASIQLPARWRLIARDAFNGTILWKRGIERWNTTQYPLKSGPAHLLRRLVAKDNRVYVTLGIDAPATALDAGTGATVRTYAGSERTREIVLSQGTLLAVADTSPSRLPDYRRNATYVWANSRHANPNWGWQGNPRQVLAYDAESGQRLWDIESPVAPCSLAADPKHIVFHDGKKLVCLAPVDGAAVWESEPAPTAIPVHTSTGPRVLIYEDVVLFAGNDGKMSGWSLRDGKKLWERKHKPSGHQSLKDLFVVNGLVWTGSIAASQSDGVFTAYDPFTGEQKREFPPDVEVHWFHHRCYPSKATEKYLLSARNGTEYIDLTTERWKPNHWVRGGCIYGVMPCNGMTYAPMHACGCQLEAKLTGFNALTA